MPKKTLRQRRDRLLPEEGPAKSVILHLSPETHKKLKYMAWLKETSVQKLLAKTIEALVKDVNFKGKTGAA
ncbi:MAG: hypothetical protein IPN19_12615 [Elusimicrobia bacterium]|nr:hypothetical protein [Elusimicrobiota bacterium]